MRDMIKVAPAIQEADDVERDDRHERGASCDCAGRRQMRHHTAARVQRTIQLNEGQEDHTEPGLGAYGRNQCDQRQDGTAGAQRR